MACALAVVGDAALLLEPSAALSLGMALWACPAGWLWWQNRLGELVRLVGEDDLLKYVDLVVDQRETNEAC